MKKRITLTMDPALWQRFRVACVTRQTSASHEIEVLVQGLLNQWGQKSGGKK